MHQTGISELRGRVEYLLKLQQAAQHYTHGRRDRGWKVYEPTHFIYAFFVFNSIYSQLDWQKSIEEKTACPIEPTIEDGKEKWPYEWNLIEKVLKIARRTTDESAFASTLERQLSMLYVRVTSDLPASVLLAPQPCPLWTCEAVDDIVPDPPDGRGQVDPTLIRKFQSAWKRLVTDDPNGQSSAQSLLSLHDLIYKVRCNIFHGTKGVLEMNDPAQRRRLLIYTAIILATNIHFLAAIDAKCDLNLQVFDDPPLVRVPHGVAFYPCCGRDYDAFERMAKPLSRQLVAADLARPSGDGWLPKNGGWVKSSPWGELQDSEMTWHQCDAQKVLRELDDISLFYFRGDCPHNGEGSSGVLWLQEPLFGEVLHRLRDGALIVTDGSNGHHPETNHPHSPLWRDWGAKTTRSTKLTPPAFTYGGRCFQCVGKSERRNGPTYIWQVS